jgi:hypothetical protein
VTAKIIIDKIIKNFWPSTTNLNYIMMNIWERFMDKKKLDNTLNKDKYDSAPISIEAKTVKIS